MLYAPEIKSKETWEKTSNIYNLQIVFPPASRTINHIQIKIKDLLTNKNLILENEKLKDGIFYFQKGDKNYTNITISPSSFRGDIIINENWTPEKIYKIQVRYGSGILWNKEIEFSNWYLNNKNDFSEWSAPLLLKVINKPEISCEVSSILAPKAQGNCNFENSSEKIEFIKFDLLNDTKLDTIESSNWIPYLNSANCLYSFKTKNSADTYIKFSIKTFSGYSTSVISNKLSKIIFPVPDQKFIVKANYEKGNLEVTIPSDFQGSLWRSSSKDNYLTIEKVFEKKQSQRKNDYIFKDNAVEDGISYQYYLYFINSQIKTYPIITAYLDNNYLTDKDFNLKLEFNEKLSSFKHNIFISKMDTLGSKYPVIMKNGPSYYASFSISGLILKEEEKSSFSQNIIYQRLSLPGSTESNSIGAIELVEEPDLMVYTPQNFSRERIFNERQYRQKVEKFLTNGEYKVYRSSTEGNFIVVLTDVFLTPVEGLDRALYEFSATAYEVDEYSLENLRKYNLLKTEVI